MLQILICDDNAAFAGEMEQRITALPDFLPGVMQIHCLTDPEEMREERFTVYDLLFMDIDMGKVNGIELARRMRAVRPDAVLIFVTNFIEYAPEGYEVNAFRYLSKQELDRRLPRYFSDALTVCRARLSTVEILCKGERLPLTVRSIVYIESTGHEQCLHMKDAERKTLVTRTTMAELEELLVPHGFLRIHKGFLVNMAYLRQLKSTGAELTDGTTLPVSTRSYRENKRKFLNWTVQPQ